MGFRAQVMADLLNFLRARLKLPKLYEYLI